MNAATDPILDATAILANARALTDTIRQQREAIEDGRRLPESLVDALSSAGAFRIAMPRSWGGPEMSPLEQIELIETLAYADPSVAWWLRMNGITRQASSCNGLFPNRLRKNRGSERSSIS